MGPCLAESGREEDNVGPFFRKNPALLRKADLITDQHTDGGKRKSNGLQFRALSETFFLAAP